MKAILILTLVALSQARMMFAGTSKAWPRPAETLQLELVSGLAAGLALDLPSLGMGPCLEDLQKISTELAAVVTTISNPSFASLFKMLKEIEMVLRALPRTIQECMNELRPEVQRLSAALEVIRSPSSAEYEEQSRLSVNGVNVLEDLSKVQESFKREKWFEAGFVIGNMLNRLALAPAQ